MVFCLAASEDQYTIHPVTQKGDQVLILVPLFLYTFHYLINFEILFHCIFLWLLNMFPSLSPTASPLIQAIPYFIWNILTLLLVISVLLDCSPL